MELRGLFLHHERPEDAGVFSGERAGGDVVASAPA
jgi:hypothetical protein